MNHLLLNVEHSGAMWVILYCCFGLHHLNATSLPDEWQIYMIAHLHAGKRQQTESAVCVIIFTTYIKVRISFSAYTNKEMKEQKETYRDGPPVSELTDGVRQDERGEPENSQELTEERRRTRWATTGRWSNIINVSFRFKTYKDVEEGVAVVVVQDFDVQLLLDATFQLPNTNKQLNHSRLTLVIAHTLKVTEDVTVSLKTALFEQVHPRSMIHVSADF